MSINVADWLRGLGLEQYEQAFRDNDIDGEMLPELTADDLIGLGVTSIGHRRKLLAAIAALRAKRRNLPQTTARRCRRDLRRGRAAPADGDVLRSGRLDRALARGSIPRICARSSAPTTAASPRRSPASTASSPSTWATACWSTSATRRRTRTTPSGRCGPASLSSTRSARLASAASRCRSGSASPPGWSWSAT